MTVISNARAAINHALHRVDRSDRFSDAVASKCSNEALSAKSSEKLMKVFNGTLHSGWQGSASSNTVATARTELRLARYSVNAMQPCAAKDELQKVMARCDKQLRTIGNQLAPGGKASTLKSKQQPALEERGSRMQKISLKPVVAALTGTAQRLMAQIERIHQKLQPHISPDMSLRAAVESKLENASVSSTTIAKLHDIATACYGYRCMNDLTGDPKQKLLEREAWGHLDLGTAIADVSFALNRVNHMAPGEAKSRLRDTLGDMKLEMLEARERWEDVRTAARQAGNNERIALAESWIGKDPNILPPAGTEQQLAIIDHWAKLDPEVAEELKEAINVLRQVKHDFEVRLLNAPRGSNERTPSLEYLKGEEQDGQGAIEEMKKACASVYVEYATHVGNESYDRFMTQHFPLTSQAMMEMEALLKQISKVQNSHDHAVLMIHR